MICCSRWVTIKLSWVSAQFSVSARLRNRLEGNSHSILVNDNNNNNNNTNCNTNSNNRNKGIKYQKHKANLLRLIREHHHTSHSRIMFDPICCISLHCIACIINGTSLDCCNILIAASGATGGSSGLIWLNCWYFIGSLANGAVIAILIAKTFGQLPLAPKLVS